MLNGQLTDAGNTWLQLQVEVPRERAGELEETLQALGALSVTYADSADDPVLEPGVGETPLWPHVSMTGLFENNRNSDELLQALRASSGELEGLQVHVSVLKDQDWTRAWMDDFKPMSYGKRLWVVPGNQAVPADADAVVHLDPGLAFGSGTHPTTRMCLEWLEKQSLNGSTVLDYGCGSGILAIAAAVLGAKQVTGVDNDPQALISSRSNAANNAVSDRFEVLGPGENSLQAHDFVVANILAGALIELAPRLAGLCKPGGGIALSGIMDAQGPEVQAAYEPWFDGFETVQIDEWVLISAVRRKDRGPR